MNGLGKLPSQTVFSPPDCDELAGCNDGAAYPVFWLAFKLPLGEVIRMAA